MCQAFEGSVMSRMTYSMDSINDHWSHLDTNKKKFHKNEVYLWTSLLDEMAKVFFKFVYLCNERKSLNEGVSTLIAKLFSTEELNEMYSLKDMQKLEKIQSWNNMMWDQLKRNKSLDCYWYDDDKDYDELIQRLIAVSQLTGILCS